MVTFYANPDEKNVPWQERAGIEGHGFRIWHYIFFCSSAFTVLVVLMCCCIKFRIPRTKQEIEADYRRKKLAEKFRQRLKLIQNQEMDAIDLHRALEIIQEDYNRQQDDINKRDYNMPSGNYVINIGNREPRQSFGGKLSNVLKFAKLSSNK